MNWRKYPDRLFRGTPFETSWKSLLQHYAMSSTALRGIPRDGTVVAQVVGTPRSGSTLLATMIDGHSEAACLIEPFLAWLQFGSFDYNWNKFSLEDVERFRYWCPHKLIAKLCRDSSLEVIAFKETFRTPQHPTFPSQHFIESNYEEDGTDVTVAIIRDPRDTWSSVIRRHSHFEGDEATLSELLDAWNQLCSWVRSEDLTFVRYEDIASDPSTVEVALQRLDLEMEPSVGHPEGTKGFGDQAAQSGGPILTSSVGSYRQNLDAQVVHQIISSCSRNMRKFDYIKEV